MRRGGALRCTNEGADLNVVGARLRAMSVYIPHGRRGGEWQETLQNIAQQDCDFPTICGGD